MLYRHIRIHVPKSVSDSSFAKQTLHSTSQFSKLSGLIVYFPSPFYSIFCNIKAKGFNSVLVGWYYLTSHKTILQCDVRITGSIKGLGSVSMAFDQVGVSFTCDGTSVFAVLLEEPPNLVAFYFNLWPLNISLDLDLPVHYVNVFKCNGSWQVVYIVSILSDKFAFVEKRLHDKNGEAEYRLIFFWRFSFYLKIFYLNRIVNIVSEWAASFVSSHGFWGVFIVTKL